MKKGTTRIGHSRGDDRIVHQYEGGGGTLQSGWEFPGLTEWKEFKVNDWVIWKDDQTKRQFASHAFGYGEGPFQILSIKKDANPHREYVLVVIQTPKGKALINADSFAKQLTQT